MEEENNKELVASTPKPFGQDYFVSRPTRWNQFLRTFIPYQIWRFLVINYKMTLMIIKSHQK